MSQARVVVFRPGLAPEVTTINTSLEAMQKLVGGYLGGLQLGSGLFLYFDEDGRPRGLPTCAYVDGLGDTVVGVCIATGLDDAGNDAECVDRRPSASASEGGRRRFRGTRAGFEPAPVHPRQQDRGGAVQIR